MQNRGRLNAKALLCVVLFAAALGASACVGEYGPEADRARTTTTQPRNQPTTPSTTPGESDPEREGPADQPAIEIELSGTLAVTDEHLVVLVSPDGSEIELVDGGPDGVASQPVWSADGSMLAWSHVGEEGESVGVQGLEEDLVYSTTVGAAPFYLAWNSAADRLVYLRPDVSSGGASNGVEGGYLDPGSPSQSLATGSPFYLSWAPDVGELVALVGEAELVHISESGVRAIEGGAGPYTVPAWSGLNTVVVADEDSVDELDITTGEREDLVATQGRVRFTLSPDRTKLAYSAAANGERTGPADELRVFDLETGSDRLVATGYIVAWEWAPNSETVAWLGPPTADDVELVAAQRTGLVWAFWDDGEVERGAPYFPSVLETQGYLPFFEQFAQSHHRWSPESNAFAFAGNVDGFDGVWLQVVGHAEQPLFLTPGDAVTWGPTDALGGAGGSLL